MSRSLSYLVTAVLIVCGVSVVGSADSVTSYQQVKDGVEFVCATGKLKIQVCSNEVLRVVYTRQSAFPPPASHIVVKTDWPPVPFQVSNADGVISLATSELRVTVSIASAMMKFQTAAGQPLLEETAARTLVPKQVQTFPAYEGTLQFNSPLDEGLYGFGQFGIQDLNLRGKSLVLKQWNQTDASPVFLSTRGFGFVWNNYSQATVNPPLTLWCNWATNDAIDYYFIYGPEFDRIVAGYRTLTGAAPMWPKWAYGFWQSRNRYSTQTQLLDVVKEYRSRKLPLDNIVLDWNWYTANGSCQFDPSRFPDPVGMIKTVHDVYNCHFTISVWPSFAKGTANHQLMSSKGYLLNVNDYMGQLYDPFNQGAATQFWQFHRDSLLAKGVDSWWTDATEPEAMWHDLVTGMGHAQKVHNLFPLVANKALFEGQRQATSDKRACILTRSFYAGLQRYAAAYWSGDIQSDFPTLAKQIPSGLNYCATGMPYWCTDIGGFYGPGGRGMPSAELEARWFQYGAFCPVFRTHGNERCNEMWCSEWSSVYSTLAKYSRLRYRLFPYIYSLADRVTREGYTMYRSLPFDFRDDPQVRNCANQYMFGPSFMVCPVTAAGVTSRSVYLPSGAWYDFWTGLQMQGGRTVTAPAPLETMPIYVRAGSVLPLGPEVEFAAQKADPVEVRVYRGADGAFNLYEDEGNNYNYEKGAFSTIPLVWNEAAQNLTIGPTSGSFPGILTQRTFRIVWVSQEKGAGGGIVSAPDYSVTYTGEKITINRVTGPTTSHVAPKSLRAGAIPVINAIRGALCANVPAGASATLQVVTPSGRAVVAKVLPAGTTIVELAPGTYVVRLSGSGMPHTRAVAVMP